MASRGRRKPVGVVETARDLGVSTTTVSRALNGSPRSAGSSLTGSGHAEAREYVANRLARERRKLPITGRRSADRNDMTTGRSRALIGNYRRARNSK
jgi:hypothetical protein